MRLARRLGLAALAVAIGAATAAADAPASWSTAPAARPTAQAPVPIVEDRPWLGISMKQGIDGVLVTNVFEDSGAIASGLRPGDEVTEIDGALAMSPGELIAVVSSHEVDDVIALRVLRRDWAADGLPIARMFTTKARLGPRLSDDELVRLQLVGRRAPAFSLVRPDAPDATPVDDAVFDDKVGIAVWFDSTCGGCLDLVEAIGGWAARQPDVVAIAGTDGEDPASFAALVSTRLLTVMIGSDPAAYLAYAATAAHDATNPGAAAVVVAVVDRSGIVRHAAIIRAADDPGLDDVYAAVTRARTQRKLVR